jgi:hypothetical protein
MAGLEGTIKTPMGPVQKKTALYVAFGAAALGGIVYWRAKKGGGTGDSTPVTTDAEIDPATGYPYGSPEDAAALAAQGNYVSPPPASGGGSSTIPTTGTGFTSNGAWSQAVIEYMGSTGAVEDITALSQALGKFLTGAYVAPGSTDDLLITQAIAVEGYPPVTGPNGMPPAINRNPPNSTGGSGSTTTPPPVNNNPTLPAPTGLKASRVDREGVSLDWNPVAGAIGYKTYANGKQIGNTVTYSGAYLYDLHPNTHYTITVYPVNKSNRNGKWATISVTTKK